MKIYRRMRISLSELDRLRDELDDYAWIALDLKRSALCAGDEYIGDYFEEGNDEFTGVIPLGDPDSWAYSFGATLASKDKPFNFYVRMYCEVQANLPLKGYLPSWFPAYTMIENVVEWVPEPVTTGVKEINSAAEVGKTYYNIQGMASDKPFSGVNIVVTRYSDGSTSTSKFVR